MFSVPALPPELPAPLVVHHHKLDTRFTTLAPSANALANAFDGFKLGRLEDLAARRTRFHVLTSAEDECALRVRFPKLETSVVENGFDPGRFHASITGREQSELLFLGSLDYWPNVDGLAWFVREVLPLVVAKLPSTRLSVVGRAPTDAVRALAGKHVDVIGDVPDVRPHFARASVLVIPLRIGGGSRLKLVEAMGSATPVVSTQIGAEGFDFRDPEHLWLADDANSFARSTLEALGDPRAASERAQRGRELAVQRYTWNELALKLLACWRHAAESR
jgi:glycosyltransferase involved in cell wall biosynthesis